jgi:putative LysE/RhtB family amino acid efflux pump
VTDRGVEMVADPSLTAATIPSAPARHPARDGAPLSSGHGGSTMSALAVGFGMGFLVAAQIGPMSLFLIRSVLRGSLHVGLAIGAGIAAIDTLYAAAGAAGAAPALSVQSVRVVLGLAGAAVLLLLGARTLHAAFRVRLGAEADEEVSTPRRAFLTALGATASNPLTIASWAALFAAASVAGAADTPASAVLLLAGVGAGSLTAVTGLAVGVSVGRRWVGPRLLRAVDGTAGIGLLGFGGALGYRTLHDA